MNADGAPENAGERSADEDGKAAGSDVVSVAKRRFQTAESFYGTQRMLAIADTQFVFGDSDNGWQWPENYWQDRGLENKVRLTVNATAQHCNQIINNIRQSNPQVKVSPADDGADKRTAELIAGLVRNVQASSDADTAHDLAAEHAIYGGEGYWRIDTEFENERSFDQKIVVCPLPNPNLVYVDPSAIKPDRSDAEWSIVFEDLTSDQFKQRYPDIEMASWVQAPDDTWVGEDRVRIGDYCWCTYEDDELWFVAELDEAILKSEAKALGITTPPADPRMKRPTKRKQWKRAHLIGGMAEPYKMVDWPGKFMPIITVVGKELNIDGKVYRKGQVRDLKDPGRMLNYAYSEAVETLAIQNKTPYMAAAEALEGYEPIWKSANRTKLVYLPFNAYDEEGNALPRPTKERPPEMAVAQVQLLQLSTEQMRAASGQQNANFGIKSEAQSGVGIQRLKIQGDTATFHFPDNLRRALRYEAEVIIDLIQKVYDTRRVVRILGLDGKEEIATLDPTLQGAAYAEQPRAQAAGQAGIPIDPKVARDVERIFNPTTGTYDVVIDTGPSYQTQRQEAFAAMLESAGKDPRFMSIAGDILWKAADFPMADKVADRYEKAMPPEMRDQGDPLATLQQQNQQMKQGLQEAVQMGQALQQQVAELTRERDARLIENRAKFAIEQIKIKPDEYRAETERLQALGPALDPQAIAQLAAQAVMDALMGPRMNGGGQPPMGGLPPSDPINPPGSPQGPLPGPAPMDGGGPGAEIGMDQLPPPNGGLPPGAMPMDSAPLQIANPTGGTPGLGA